MNLQKLINKREKLTIQRDSIQKEIGDVWEVIKNTFFEELLDLGIFKAKWLYSEDISAYSYRSQILVLQDQKLIEKISKLGNIFSNIFYQNKEGWNLSIPSPNSYSSIVVMRFDHKCDPSEIVKKYGINVDFSYLDKEIKEKEAKKKLFYKD